jgi:hemin uptake protein HemP
MKVDKAIEAAGRVSDTSPLYDARDLIKDGDTARIMLDDQVYTLRLTRSGKLILTK